MFDTETAPAARPVRAMATRALRRPPSPGAVSPLADLRERARPVSERRTQLLPVPDPLAGLLPARALERGTTVGVLADAAGGATTVALALVAAASAAGSWCVGVGLGDLGVVAAQELGLDLGRLAVVPWPGGQWAAAVATLVEEVDVVLVRPPARVPGHLARRLGARLRTRRAVLVVVGADPWPEPCDVVLRVDEARWEGVGPGADRLHRRLATVSVVARRGDPRPRRARLWLPGPDGSLATGGPDAPRSGTGPGAPAAGGPC